MFRHSKKTNSFIFIGLKFESILYCFGPSAQLQPHAELNKKETNAQAQQDSDMDIRARMHNKSQEVCWPSGM
jgi:hypothetical protein